MTATDKSKFSDGLNNDEVRLIIFSEAVPVINKISTYLKKKEFIVHETSDLSVLLNALSNESFDIVFISAGLAKGKLAKIPELLLKAFNLKTIGFCSKDESQMYGRLRQMNCADKIQGQPSGMSFYRSLQKLFASDKENYSMKSGVSGRAKSSSIKVKGSKSLKEQMLMSRQDNSQSKKIDNAVKEQLMKMAGVPDKDQKADGNKVHLEKSVSANKANTAHQEGEKSDTKKSVAESLGNDKVNLSLPEDKKANPSDVAIKKDIDTKSKQSKQDESSSKKQTAHENLKKTDTKKSTQDKTNKDETLDTPNIGNKSNHSNTAMESTDSTDSKMSMKKSNKTEQSSAKEEMGSNNSKTNVQEGIKSDTKVVLEDANGDDLEQKDNANIDEEKTLKESSSDEAVTGAISQNQIDQLFNESLESENVKEEKTREEHQCLYAILVKNDSANELYFLSIITDLINKEDKLKEINRIIAEDLDFDTPQFITELPLDYPVKLEEYSLGINKKQVITGDGWREVEYTDKVESLSLPKIINEQMALMEVENIPTEIELSFSLFLYLEKNMKYYSIVKPGNSFSVDLKTRLLIADKSVYLQTIEIQAFYKDFCLSMYKKIKDPSVDQIAA